MHQKVNPDQPFWKPPTHATAGPKLTLGDLDQTVTIREVQALLEDFRKQLTSETLPAIEEHWTDGEGLHHIPYTEDVESSTAALADDYLAHLARGDYQNPPLI